MNLPLFTSEGWMDLEQQYVPGCVAAELQDGRAESMRALAVAARTYVLRAMDEDSDLGTEAKPIPNHFTFQVFQRTAPGSVREVALATRGIVCRYGGSLILCNHVLGAPWDDSGKPLPDDLTDTEQYVTYNNGKTGAAVKPSPLSNMSRSDNRGCLSTRGADWLARQGYKYPSILRFFYGADLYIAPIDVPAPVQPQGQTPPAQPTGPGQTLPASFPIEPESPPPGNASPLALLALAAFVKLAME